MRTRLNKGVTELSNDRASRVYATHREIVERHDETRKLFELIAIASGPTPLVNFQSPRMPR